MRIQRLQTRIIVFFVALLALVQVAAFWFVNAANSRNAQAKVAEELNVGQRVFARLLDQNAEKLKLSARVLAADFAFREAIATHDTGTIASVLANHGARIGAAAMVFVDLNGSVVADTLSPQASAHAFVYPELLRRNAASASMEVLDGRAFQLVAVPVLAPLPIGWVVMGFAVDDALASDLRNLTELEVTFALDAPQGRRVLASTLDDRDQKALLSDMPSRSNTVSRLVIKISGVDHQALVIPLDHNENARIVAVLHRSLGDALAAFGQLRNTLFVLAALSLVLSIIGSVAVAGNITRPLEALASAAARIELGDYSAPVNLKRSDEIGVLASSLNHMRGGIADREKRILKLAYEDPLTDLANRSRFSNELALAITQAMQGNLKLTILMMDLDRFKYVNDTLGHGVGDHVLREVSTRLQQTVTSAECIARLGGDEFAILIKQGAGQPEENADFARTSREIIAALEAPILFEGQPLDVGTSIGIAHFPEHGRDAQTLVRNADIAMYAAKRNKTGFATYEQHYDTSQQEHLSLLGELRRAVERNELRLYYQPKVSLHSSHVSAVEALIRWEHPTRGLVPPAQFIPFAEHTGYIKLLTRWVIREAVRQCGEWLREGLTLQVSVNISARDLMNRDLPEHVAELLAEHDVTPGLLCLEITESGFMEDPAHAQKVLDRLAELGVKLSIDDYGTGYSSLSYIMKLPVQELKIDQSFISRMADDEEISTIVRSTIDLGHNLGLQVVAEGVEDEAVWDMLRKLGCDDAQGYFMSKPLEAHALASWIRDNHGKFSGLPSSGLPSSGLTPTVNAAEAAASK
ncbi:MAG TPA: EAL domain-containing protein [Steroidobacteraceae bacterium]|jgi:diguanylate cyclase (GGDEF)-like protein|nr:EAL domain-containing protein [Steroidobacteraceae bacterium]